MPYGKQMVKPCANQPAGYRKYSATGIVIFLRGAPPPDAGFPDIQCGADNWAKQLEGLCEDASCVYSEDVGRCDFIAQGCADNCLHALGEVQHDSYKFTGVVVSILVSPRLDQMLGGATQEPDFSYHKKPGLSPTDRQRTPFATWQSELSTV